MLDTGPVKTRPELQPRRNRFDDVAETRRHVIRNTIGSIFYFERENRMFFLGCQTLFSLMIRAFMVPETTSPSSAEMTTQEMLNSCPANNHNCSCPVDKKNLAKLPDSRLQAQLPAVQFYFAKKKLYMTCVKKVLVVDQYETSKTCNLMR